jgi:hypothetical protein
MRRQFPEVSKCFSGFTARCVVEFYLEWLDELVDLRDYDSEAAYGNVVAGLYRLASDRRVPFIADGYRPFPVYATGNGPWPDLKMLNPEEFAASIEPQLLDLERREAVSRVLPHAIQAFGLTPQSSADEIAAVQ